MHFKAVVLTVFKAVFKTDCKLRHRFFYFSFSDFFLFFLRRKERNPIVCSFIYHRNPGPGYLGYRSPTSYKLAIPPFGGSDLWHQRFFKWQLGLINLPGLIHPCISPEKQIAAGRKGMIQLSEKDRRALISWQFIFKSSLLFS